MEKDNKTREYEVLYFLPISVSTEEVEAVKQKISQFITKNDGLIIKEEDLGKKKLSYMIKRARHGYYLLTIFKIDPAAVQKIDHEITLMPEILRHRLALKQAIKRISTRSGLDQELRKPVLIDKKPPTDSKKDIDQASPPKPESKVDIEELDRTIDQLLEEHNI